MSYTLLMVLILMMFFFSWAVCYVPDVIEDVSLITVHFDFIILVQPSILNSSFSFIVK